MATIILRDNSTPNVRAAAASAVAAAASATAAASSAGAAAAVGVSLVGPYLASKATRPSIISAGTSAVGTTQDNTGLAAGVADRSGSCWVRLADWTPASNVPVYAKFASNLGTKIWVTTTGLLRLEYGNGSNFTTYRFDSSVATGVTDGSWALIAWTEDRDGNLTWYVNGAALGSTVSISAASAQTVTNTGALLWGSDGSTHSAGTFGEVFTIAGLLTSTQIANIYAAGSIAPFCTYTANTTTGQNTATIGGLSFYQWLDFGQGYGPIIRDRSGNNQHALMGTTGLVHAVPRNPPGLPARAPKSALNINGVGGSKINFYPNTQSFGTGDFLAWVDLRRNGAPSDTTFSAAFGMGSGSTTVVAEGLAFRWQTANVAVFLFGATTSDYNAWTCSNLVTLLGTDNRAIFAMTRSSTTVNFYLMLNGDLFNITNLGVYSTGGSPAGWGGSVLGTLGFVGHGIGTTAALNADIFDTRTGNVAMTEAQLRTEYERGEPGQEWRGATKTAAYSSDFSAGVNGWTANRVTLTAPATVAAQANALKINNAPGALGQGIQRTLVTVIGRRYRLTFSAYIPSGNEINSVQAYSGNAITGSNMATKDAWTTVTVDFTAASTTIALINEGINTDAAAYSAVYGITLTAIGYTARLRTDTAAGLTALNSAKSSTNDSTDFLLSTTGVTTSPDGRTQTIRAQTTTNGNQQLLGASVIDTTKNWRIRFIESVPLTGTPTVTHGSVSGGSGYVTSVALAAGSNDLTAVTRKPLTANWWVNSNSTDPINHTIVLDLID